MSLVELAVSMMVGAILFGGIATVFVGTLQANRTVNTKTSTGADVRLAIEALSRTLKVATTPYGSSAAFTSATGTGLSFYTLLNRTGTASTAEPIPTLVSYEYASGCLTEYQTKGSAITNPAVGGPYFQWPTSARSSKCLLRTTTPPSFTYYASYTSPSDNEPTADLTQIRNVLISLTGTDVNNPGVGGVPAETLVSLENLINADGGSS